MANFFGDKSIIEEAKAHVRRMKRAHPWIYPEYVDLQRAKQALDEAKAEFARARARWNELGT